MNPAAYIRAPGSSFLFRKRLLPLALLAVHGVLATVVQADETMQVKRERPMPVIEVIGRSEDAVSRQTGSVVILTAADFDRMQPISTEDVLRRVPGINTKSEEETSIVANIGLRGLSASESKSLVLEDGVPVAPGLFIGNERYFNPRIQRMERIEVLKGSAGLRYGPSTIGGVINYQTKTPDDGVILSGRVGSFDTRETTLEAGGRTRSGDAFGGIVVTHARSDGFMDKGYEMTDVMIKTGLAIGDRQSLGLKVSWHENDANISYRGLLLGDFEAGATYNPAPDDFYLTDRIAFDVNHEIALSEQATLTTLLYFSDVTRDYWRYDVDTPASNAAGRWVYRDTLTGNNRSFERYGFDTRLTFEHALFGIANDAEIGVRGLREESDDTRIRATREQDRTGINDRHRIDSAESIALYAQNRFAVTDRLALTPGVRIEYYEQQQKVLTQNNATAKTSNTEVLPGIGFTFDLVDGAQLYGGVYRAFAPATNGVALDGLMDQNLDAERSDNFELGVRGHYGALTFEAAVFRMDFDNQVVTGNSDPNLSQSNAGKTLHQGGELALAYDLGAGFALSGNVTYIPTSKFESGEHEGNRVPYAPKLLANAALEYSQAGFRTALMVHHRGAQFGDSSNQRDIPSDAAGGIWGGRMNAYTLFDLTAQYDVTPQLLVFGAVKNLTDKRYITGFRQGIYVGPERSFELGARYHF